MCQYVLSEGEAYSGKLVFLHLFINAKKVDLTVL